MQGQAAISAILASLLLFAGCTDTPQRDYESEIAMEGECPDWKIPVVVNGRVVCTDEEVLEREREMMELDDDW